MGWTLGRTNAQSISRGACWMVGRLARIMRNVYMGYSLTTQKKPAKLRTVCIHSSRTRGDNIALGLVFPPSSPMDCYGLGEGHDR
jgi:hypothetical protein